MLAKPESINLEGNWSVTVIFSRFSGTIFSKYSHYYKYSMDIWFLINFITCCMYFETLQSDVSETTLLECIRWLHEVISLVVSRWLNCKIWVANNDINSFYIVLCKSLISIDVFSYVIWDKQRTWVWNHRQIIQTAFTSKVSIEKFKGVQWMLRCVISQAAGKNIPTDSECLNKQIIQLQFIEEALNDSLWITCIFNKLTMYI